MSDKKPIPIRLTGDQHHRLKIAAAVNSTTMGELVMRGLDALEELQKLKMEKKPKETKKKTPRRR